MIDKYIKKAREENFKMKRILGWFLDYAEEDDYLTKENGEKTYTFPNVVISMSEEDFNEMKKIVT